MTRFEYTAIPAPSRTEKAKDAKTASDRYAAVLTAELNRMAADGWEYIRADVLPSEERSGLAGRTTVYHNLLIFRKEVEAQASRKNHRQQVKQPAPVVSPEPAAAPEDMAQTAQTPTSAEVSTPETTIKSGEK